MSFADLDHTHLDRVLYAMAAEHVNDNSMWDDCVQEARIAVWKVRERMPDMSLAYYNKVARSRIQEVSKRQTWLGHTGRRGYPIDPMRRAHDSLDQLRETGYFDHVTVGLAGV